MRDPRNRLPDLRAYTVNVGQAWAWVLLWAFLAFLPAAFSILPDHAFYLALACTVGLGASFSLTAYLNRRARPSRKAPPQAQVPAR